MATQPISVINRILAPVPGWLLLVGGMSMLAAATLMPDWQQNHKMAWELDLMRHQADQMKDQETRYHQFYEAVKNDDPIVIERLAYYQFRLKPAGSTPVHDVTQAPPSGPLLRTVSQRNIQTTKGAPALAVSSPTVDQLLQRPIAQPGVNYPVYHPVESRLVAMTNGPARFVLIAAGLMCLLTGLLAPVSAADIKVRNAESEQDGDDEHDGDEAVETHKADEVNQGHESGAGAVPSAPGALISAIPSPVQPSA